MDPPSRYTLAIAAITLLPAQGCARRSAEAVPPAAATPPARSQASRPVAVAARPAAWPAASSFRLGDLQRQLEALAGSVPAKSAAIYWEDLESGQAVRIRAATPFESASLIKIPVAAAVLDRWERRSELRTPERERVMWKMIAESNNRAVDVMAEHAGGLEAVNRFCRQQGWRETVMNHYFRDWRQRKARNRTSARDVAAMLRAIDNRTLVSPAASDFLWSLLRDQTMRQRIPAGIPPDAGAETGNKTGTLRSVLHDAAIVRAPGARYLLCILTSAPSSEPAGDEYCRTVSRAVWDAVTGR